ncbi:MAG: RNase adaptor protein RapZ [Deltaproteobacteria bacterium RBG_13_58_19]|nr:MAG: RNase adaptor protein RapZ [Deltaproteobacteria bacterium RBG_13_58_19]
MGQNSVTPKQPGQNLPIPLPVLIITGLSGSGKSTVLRALEDVGYFCVDNLPLSLLSPFLQKLSKTHQDGRRVALVMDVRTEGFLKNYARVFRRLEGQGYQIHLLFLEADESALIRRFSQTRRQHPWADKDSISEALRLERTSLEGLRRLAHRIINTSFYNPHQLRQLIIAEYSDLAPRQQMLLHLISFAYKNGIPPEADLVMDVRFLPNPFFVEELKQHTGNEPQVRDYVLNQTETREFLSRFFGFLDFLLPLFQKEGKTHLTVAIGCTGGQHRSVVLANVLGDRLSQENYPFTLTHRDLAQS